MLKPCTCVYTKKGTIRYTAALASPQPCGARRCAVWGPCSQYSGSGTSIRVLPVCRAGVEAKFTTADASTAECLASMCTLQRTCGNACSPEPHEDLRGNRNPNPELFPVRPHESVNPGPTLATPQLQDLHPYIIYSLKALCFSKWASCPACSTEDEAKDAKKAAQHQSFWELALTQRLHSSSFLGLPYRILNMNPKRELWLHHRPSSVGNITEASNLSYICFCR